MEVSRFDLLDKLTTPRKDGVEIRSHLFHNNNMADLVQPKDTLAIYLEERAVAS